MQGRPCAPMRRTAHRRPYYVGEPSNPGANRNLVSGGHKARPYGKTRSGSVGADFISARAAPPRWTHHRRTHAPQGRVRNRVRSAQGRRSMHSIPVGYLIRPYGVDESLRSADCPGPGAGGPMWASAPTRRNHRTSALTTCFRAAKFLYIVPNCLYFETVFFCKFSRN